MKTSVLGLYYCIFWPICCAASVLWTVIEGWSCPGIIEGDLSKAEPSVLLLCTESACIIVSEAIRCQFLFELLFFLLRGEKLWPPGQGEVADVPLSAVLYNNNIQLFRDMAGMSFTQKRLQIRHARSFLERVSSCWLAKVSRVAQAW